MDPSVSEACAPRAHTAEDATSRLCVSGSCKWEPALQECKDLPSICIPWGTIQPKGSQRVDNSSFFIPTKAVRMMSFFGCVLHPLSLWALLIQRYGTSLCFQGPHQSPPNTIQPLINKLSLTQRYQQASWVQSTPLPVGITELLVSFCLCGQIVPTTSNDQI